ASDIVDRIDRVTGSIFGFAGKSPPEKFSGDDVVAGAVSAGVAAAAAMVGRWCTTAGGVGGSVVLVEVVEMKVLVASVGGDAGGGCRLWRGSSGGVAWCWQRLLSWQRAGY
nr:hypothetical protein [Tanacetum cinerariifolium]